MGSSTSKAVKTKQEIINETTTNINNNISASLTNTIKKKTQSKCASSTVQSIDTKNITIDNNSGNIGIGNKAKVNVTCYLQNTSITDLRKDLSNSIMDALTKTMDSTLLNKINSETKTETGSLSSDKQNITSDTYSKNNNTSNISTVVSNNITNDIDETVISEAISLLTQSIKTGEIKLTNNSGTFTLTNDIEAILKSETVNNSTTGIIDKILNSKAFEEDIKTKTSATADTTVKSESTGFATMITSVGSAISGIIGSVGQVYALIIVVVICCCCVCILIFGSIGYLNKDEIKSEYKTFKSRRNKY